MTCLLVFKDWIWILALLWIGSEFFLKDRLDLVFVGSGFWSFLQDVGFLYSVVSKIQRKKKLTDTDFKSLVFSGLGFKKFNTWTVGYSG